MRASSTAQSSETTAGTGMTNTPAPKYTFGFVFGKGRGTPGFSRKHVTRVQQDNLSEAQMRAYTSMAGVGLPRLQALVRRQLVRQEYKSLQKDKLLVFERGVLVKSLVSMSRSRTTLIYGLGYLVYLALVLSILFLFLSPSVQFDAGGNIKRRILERQVNGQGFTFMDIHTASDFYDFITYVLIAKTHTVSFGTEKYFYMGAQGAEQIPNPITISQLRGTTTTCSKLYTKPESQSYFSNDNCVLGLEDGYDTTDFGTGMTSVMDVIVPTINSQYIGTTATKCPKFDWNLSRSSQYSMGSFAVQMPMGPTATTTDWTNIVSMLKRCSFIDRQTREVSIELDLLAGMYRPIYVSVTLTVSFSLLGGTDPSYSIKTVDTTNPEKDSNVTSIRALMGTLAAFSAVSVVLTFLDLINIGLKTSFRFMMKCSVDVFVWAGILHAILLWISIERYTNYMSKQYIVSTGDYSQYNVPFNYFKQDLNTLGSASWSFTFTFGNFVFLTFLRTLQYVRHRGMMSLVQRSFQSIAIPLGHFVATLLPLFAAYIVYTYLLLGPAFESYSTLTRSTAAILLLLFGWQEESYKSLADYDGQTAFIFLLTFNVVVITIFMAFFISIILEGYRSMTLSQDIDKTASDEIIRNVTMSVQASNPYLISAEQVVWMLLHEPTLNTKDHVTLRDMKVLVHHSFHHEVGEVMFEIVMAGRTVSAYDAAKRLFSKRQYRYFRVQPAFPFRLWFVPSGLKMPMHLVYFHVLDAWRKVRKLIRGDPGRNNAVYVAEARRKRRATAYAESKGMTMMDTFAKSEHRIVLDGGAGTLTPDDTYGGSSGTTLTQRSSRGNQVELQGGMKAEDTVVVDGVKYTSEQVLAIGDSDSEAGEGAPPPPKPKQEVSPWVGDDNVPIPPMSIRLPATIQMQAAADKNPGPNEEDL